MSEYRQLGEDSSEEVEADTIATERTPMLELEPQPEPEPAASAVHIGVEVDRKLTLTIAPKAAKDFILKKQALKRGHSGIGAEDFAAAMSTIPGLPKRKDQAGGALLSYTINRADEKIEADNLVIEINKRLEMSGGTHVVATLLLAGEDLCKFDGLAWSDLDPKHISEAGSLPLEAKLFSANKHAFEHTQSVIAKARNGGTEADTEGLSDAKTPNCAVDPLSLTVPIRVAFRLRDIPSVDLAAREFTARFYLELQWVEKTPPSPLLRARSGSTLPPQTPNSSRASSAGGGETKEATQAQNKFEPQLEFENLVGDAPRREKLDLNICTSMDQLQRFWGAVNAEATDIKEYTLFRMRWNGSARFSIDAQDVGDAPFDPVRLKIKVRCRYATWKVCTQDTISGLPMLTVVPLTGRVGFHSIDTGLKFVDIKHLESSLDFEPGSWLMEHACKRQHTIEEVVRKSDSPSIDISFQYKGRLLPYRVNWILPSFLLGNFAMATVWFGSDSRIIVNAVLMIGAAIAPVLGGMAQVFTPLGTLHVYLIGTAVYVWLVTLIEVMKTESHWPGSELENEEGSASSPKLFGVAGLSALGLAQLACFGVWLIASFMLSLTRKKCGCCLARHGKDPKEKVEELPQSLVEMTASLMHTQWRKDREESCKGECVPRWKMISADESKKWLAQFNESERDSFKGMLYAEAPIANSHQKEWLDKLQAITDASRIPDPMDPSAGSNGSSSPRSRDKLYGQKQKQSTAEILEWIGKYIEEYPDDDRTQMDTMYLVDINSDYAVLPETWQKQNRVSAGACLKLIREKPDLRDEDLSDEVHVSWLSRNEWAKDGKLGVSFDLLPVEEQAKDLAIVVVCKLVLSTEKELRHDFKLMDTNNNGFLEAAECERAFDVYSDDG